MKTSHLVLGWLLAPAGVAAARVPTIAAASAEVAEDACPPCEQIFSKLEYTTSGEGKRYQRVEVMERGEPKSGTGFMFEWAGNMLIHMCDYLNDTFGQSSCTINMNMSDDNLRDLRLISLTFEPRLGDYGAPCPCNEVYSVFIGLSSRGKHMLPMSALCPLAHKNGVLYEENGCIFADGTLMKNVDDIQPCIAENSCPVHDRRQQMVVMRDPRPVVVSSYFFALAHHKGALRGESLDAYVVRMFPTVCQWVAIRYYFFEDMVPDKAIVFWYDDSLEDPVLWHSRWLEWIGLQPPTQVVKAATDAAAARDFRFYSKGVDKHIGGKEATVKRTYADELKPETLADLEDVMRTWLPPELLHRFGVSST